MDYRTGFRDGYNAAREDMISAMGADYLPMSMATPMSPMEARALDMPTTPRKKRASAYSKRYKAAFKKIAPKYKLKSGKWKKDGFRMAVKQAHKMAKK